MAFHILVVDDQRDVSKAIRMGVQSLGPEFAVATAMSGEEAMLEARLRKFDLLISEIRLTGMSGVELLRKLRALKPDIKVILTVTSLDRYIRREVSDVGVDALLQKPIEISELLPQIESLLRVGVPSETPLPEEVETEAEPLSISDRLSVLRHDLNASLALLISDTGEILIQAGDSQQINLEAEIASLLAIFSAGHRISRLLGATIVDNSYTFKGNKHDLIMTHVGESHALLIATGPGGISLEQAASATQVIRKGTQDLQAILTDMGVALSTVEEPSTPVVLVSSSEEEVEIEEELIEFDPALDALFSKVEDKVKESDLDSFWEVGASEDSGVFASADALSYEQARQLGLAPEEE